MGTDPKKLVAAGYDRIAETYLARFGASAARDRWLAVLLDTLPHGGDARVLDLGCGAGIPVARAVAAAGHFVVGVDGSARQISLARSNVPDGDFLCADMSAADFPAESFDAVAAFYSITHVPCAEHGRLLGRIVDWLKPHGVFVASLGSHSSLDWSGDWMETGMFFSHYDASTNLVLLREAGFIIERSEVLDQDNEDARFLWVLARKPEPAKP